MCASACAFTEVLTMSGFRFRVVLCAYERYIMPLYMYYRVVGKTLKERLADAISEEQYELAAELRDRLNKRDSM